MRRGDAPSSPPEVDPEEALSNIAYRISPYYMSIYRDARSKLDVFLTYLRSFLKTNRFGINFVDAVVTSSEFDFYFDRSLTELPQFVVLVPFRRPAGSKSVRLNENIEDGYSAIQISQDSNNKDDYGKLRVSSANPNAEHKRYLSKSGSIRILRDVLVPNWQIILRACTRALRGFQGSLRCDESPDAPLKLIAVFTVQMTARQAIESGFIAAEKVDDRDRQVFQYEFTAEFGVAMSVEYETGFKDAHLTTLPYFSTDEHATTESLWHFSYKPIEARMIQTVCQADRMQRLEAATCLLYIVEHHPLFRGVINKEHVRSALLYAVDYEIDSVDYRRILECQSFSFSWQRKPLAPCFISILQALLPFVRRGVFPHFFIAKLDLFRFSIFSERLPTIAQVFPPRAMTAGAAIKGSCRDRQLRMLQMLIANWIRSPVALVRDLTEMTHSVRLQQEKAEKEMGKLINGENRSKTFMVLIGEGDPLYKSLSLFKQSKNGSSSKATSVAQTRSRHSRQTARSSQSFGGRLSISTGKQLPMSPLTPTIE